MLPTVEESRGYDFLDPENADKWQGIFVTALRKVLEQSHPSLNCEESALEYTEQLILRLLSMLCTAPYPLTVQDVEDRVVRMFPNPLDKWSLIVAREVMNRKNKQIMLPVDKIHSLLQKEVLLNKIDMSVTLYITAILEFISSDILKLAGNFVKKISQKSGYDTITCTDVKTAMCADRVLMDMFYQDSELALADPAACNDPQRRGSLSYSELVRDLITDERHFLRELNLIIRVFKEKIERLVDNDVEAVNLIFGNIMDIYELTVTLLGNLEDACEVAQDSPTDTPYIGSCFEELAEVEEFRAYVRYAHIITKKESRDALQNIVDDPSLGERLDTAGQGFRLAVKYYLPRLLLAPLAHAFLYHSYILALLQIAPTPDDRESFKQVECNLHPIKKVLMKALGNGPKMSDSEYRRLKSSAAGRAAAVAVLDSEPEVESEIEEVPRAKKQRVVKSAPRKEKDQKKKLSGKSKPSTSIANDLFGEETEQPTAAKTPPPLWSSLTRRVADGTLRQATLLDGSFFFDIRVYNTGDIINLPVRERPDHTSAHLRLQVEPDDPLWIMIKNIFKEGKGRFDKEAVFYANKK